MPQKASTVLMVPPEHFQFNHETAQSNTFQSHLQIGDLGKKALNEFSVMRSALREQGIQILELHQNKDLPDAVFPNNWFSTHVDAQGHNIVIIYPMMAKNRQEEVNIEGLQNALSQAEITIDKIIDLRNPNNEILEGTGSLVLDRENQILYASLSPRTTAKIVHKVARILNYTPIIFDCENDDKHPVYHTNVILSITRHYVVICLESIKDLNHKTTLIESFQQSNKEIIEITLQQMQHMCGNVLELFNNKGESLLVLSTRAKEHFNTEQLGIIQRHSKLVPVDIHTIETIGGGSARCMMAEIFYAGC